MDITKSGHELRQKAEGIAQEKVAQSSGDLAARPPYETLRMRHELQVHQIELKMQSRELREAQAEGEAAGSRYFDFYDLAPVGYVTLSAEGLILEANLTAASLLGVARAALIEQRFTKFILPEDQDKLYRHCKKLLAVGESRAWELRMLKKDGTSFWARSEEIAVSGAHNALVRRIVLTDITERKQIEEVLVFLAHTGSPPTKRLFFDELARYLAQSLGMDFVCIDRLEGDGLVARRIAVWYNGRFEDNVTYALKDTPCGDVVGKIVCCFPANVCQVFPRDQVLQHLRAESYVGVTLWSHTGQPIGLISAIGRGPLANRQLAETILKLVAARAAGELERQEAEDALRASEARYTATLNAVNDGLWDWHIPSGKAFFSALYYTMLSYQNGEFPATYDSWRLLVHPEDIDRVERELRASVETGNGFSIDLRMRKKDDHWLWVSTRGKLMERDASGKALRMVGTLSDITERKRAEAGKETLEAQNRQLQKSESLGRMAGAIAHHFNNKLQAVMGNLELALLDLPQNGGPGETVTEAMQAARQAAEVSRTMLTYLGLTVARCDPLDLAEVCHGQLPMLRAGAPQIVVLVNDLPSPGPTINANGNQIRQVLTNLVTNAWESMGEAMGVIRLTVKTVPVTEIPATLRFPSDWQPHDPAYGCLEVMDTGCGIPAQDLEKIFDPFFSSKFTGRGMGLAVVLGIVRTHNGAITVESEPGRRSVFRVFFPLSVEAMACLKPSSCSR